jgi:hypothetical protein
MTNDSNKKIKMPKVYNKCETYVMAAACMVGIYFCGTLIGDIVYNNKPSQALTQLKTQHEQLASDSTFYAKTMPLMTAENQKAYQDSVKLTDAKIDSIDALIQAKNAEIHKNFKRAENWCNPFYNKK